MAVDFDNDLILITAASGKQAGALLPHLVQQWKRLRLQCISDSSAARLREQYPNAEVVQSGFGDPGAAQKLLQGVTACFLVCPACHPRETQHCVGMIDAAVAASQAEGNNSNSSSSSSSSNGGSGGKGVFQHLVLSSVLHPIFSAMSNHDNKRLVEEQLQLSGLNFTVVQPSHLMENAAVGPLAEEERPVFASRCNPDIAFSFTALYDLGEVVANVLRERERHYFATYEIVSTATPMNYVEAMEIVSAEIGKKVEISVVPHEETANGWAETLETATPAERRVMCSGMLRMLAFYESKGLIGNSLVTKMLLGREPLSYRDWVRQQLK